MTATQNGHPRFYEILNEIADLHSRKNADYTGGQAANPLGNFVRVAIIMGMYPGMEWSSPTGVALVYMLKQLDAALILLQTSHATLTGEPFESRMRDVGVYALLAEILHSR